MCECGRALTHTHTLFLTSIRFTTVNLSVVFSSDCTAFFRAFASSSYLLAQCICYLDACCFGLAAAVVIFLTCAWNVISRKTYIHLHAENNNKKMWNSNARQGRPTAATAPMTATTCVAVTVLEIVVKILGEKKIDRQQSHVHKLQWVVDQYT